LLFDVDNICVDDGSGVSHGSPRCDV